MTLNASFKPHGVAALLIAGAAIAITPSAVSAQEKIVAEGETVRIQEYPGTILHLSQWAAADHGFCEDHGIKCEMVKIPSGPVGLQALAAGSLDVSFASTEVTMQAASRGNDVQLIVGHSPNNIYTLSVHKDVELPNKDKGYPAVMEDLKGKNIGVTARGAGTELQARALLIGAGMSGDDVTYIGVGAPGTSYPAFLARQIDAGMMFEPFATLCRLQETCVDVVDLAAGEGPEDIAALNGAFETYAARRDFIEENPQVVGAFIQAMSEATDWVKDPDNHEELMEIVKGRFQLGDDIPDADKVLDELVRRTAPLYGVEIDRDAVNAFSDYLIDNELIEDPVSADTFVYAEAPKP
ncbi:ABC transporter substrate-binding protein [Pseudohoeflea coraliihabitans]|uniref:ABC transporter substrate-binding protein n=1 Tax=Pseudohoeflea coraliihabitans TaxID=2860393 RepID=A0ABS6WL99_9HYPH|nr:ABC transporter substrate-binding protein [Pseudohoeflea sp. DP4N28-3]MBW3096438.1 ABC transporter substrate-binding protein [Pseudohoeflea sp. DP4N28-3]